jgi:hypothetical protein
MVRCAVQLLCVLARTKGEVRLGDNKNRILGSRRTIVTGLDARLVMVVAALRRNIRHGRPRSHRSRITERNIMIAS